MTFYDLKKKTFVVCMDRLAVFHMHFKNPLKMTN
uniref:Uncharacterized protein n=1 Tax=Anguilla anguilla TaxID=7936 RepID=A0A0E9PSM6_ANGAN